MVYLCYLSLIFIYLIIKRTFLKSEIILFVNNTKHLIQYTYSVFYIIIARKPHGPHRCLAAPLLLSNKSSETVVGVARVEVVAVTVRPAPHKNIIFRQPENPVAVSYR